MVGIVIGVWWALLQLNLSLFLDGLIPDFYKTVDPIGSIYSLCTGPRYHTFEVPLTPVGTLLYR